VVDDGSTDETAEVLRACARRDRRVRPLFLPHGGLTAALIAGCDAARGRYIARQDTGDQSLPERLSRQAGVLDAHPGVVAVTCHTVMAGPRDEVLYVSEIDQDRLNESLKSADPATLAGPSHHGSVMMRRDVYARVGGYRKQFYFAQDLDLWTRLAEVGDFAVIPEACYRARLDPGSISAMQAPEQRRLKELIAKASAARRSEGDEAYWLAQAATVRKVSDDRAMRRVAAGNYFIGSCLRARDPKAAASYFRAAVEHDVRHWRAWARFLECTIRGRLGRQAVGSASTGDA